MRSVHTKFTPGSSESGRVPRILVADDDPIMRRRLVEALDEDGYEVEAVGTGLELFDHVWDAHMRRQPPALIVSDIRVPDRSGLELLRTVRGLGWTIPVVLITSLGEQFVMREAVWFGATCVFGESFDMDDLRTAVMVFIATSAQPSPPPRKSTPPEIAEWWLPFGPYGQKAGAAG